MPTETHADLAYEGTGPVDMQNYMANELVFFFQSYHMIIGSDYRPTQIHKLYRTFNATRVKIIFQELHYYK